MGPPLKEPRSGRRGRTKHAHTQAKPKDTAATLHTLQTLPRGEERGEGEGSLTVVCAPQPSSATSLSSTVPRFLSSRPCVKGDYSRREPEQPNPKSSDSSTKDYYEHSVNEVLGKKALGVNLEIRHYPRLARAS